MQEPQSCGLVCIRGSLPAQRREISATTQVVPPDAGTEREWVGKVNAPTTGVSPIAHSSRYSNPWEQTKRPARAGLFSESAGSKPHVILPF
jgi:hypothetical protein